MSHLIEFKTPAAIFGDTTESPLSSERRETRRAGTDDVAFSTAAPTPLLQITRHDVQQLGLDPSRETPFVEELSQIYFNANVRVQDGAFRDLAWWILSLVCCSNHT